MKNFSLQVINHSLMSLLHLSISFDNWQGFQILFKIENNLEKWNKDIDANTILHTACKTLNTKFLNALCQDGRFSTDYLNVTNQKGLSSFHCLCSVDSDKWMNNVVNRVGLKFELTCKEGNTPFITSVISGNLQLAKLLFSKGVNIDHQNKNGFSALHYASMKNLPSCVQQLIEWNAKIDTKNKYGLTPLCFAVINDNKDIVEFLIKYEANMNIADRHGWTVLHHAVKRNNVELLKCLLDNKAKVNCKNKKRRTPLMLAYSIGNIKAAMEILPYVTV